MRTQLEKIRRINALAQYVANSHIPTTARIAILRRLTVQLRNACLQLRREAADDHR